MIISNAGFAVDSRSLQLIAGVSFPHRQANKGFSVEETYRDASFAMAGSFRLEICIEIWVRQNESMINNGKLISQRSIVFLRLSTYCDMTDFVQI